MKQGFTLIELLVVIAIIGLLASIVTVAVQRGRGEAKVSGTIADLRNLAQAVQMYKIDSQEIPPFDHSWSDNCEKAMFNDGNFSPKPAGWSGPYVGEWPSNEWGGAYHWEHSSQGLPFSISVQNVPTDAANAIDDQADDGNTNTGIIRWNGSRMEYQAQISGTHKHITSC